ncbi:divergent polysaccharide deacetylase family protein [Campylobacter devanensis]|uniref:divergent polysaccharide deacetylase family protein n=1 Tax=Campylobacter devanensis TaxID=3161138 RepID=UPI000A336E7F|nr:divergent polysaccharide deacetylase family protein [Campylobacter sp. P0088]
MEQDKKNSAQRNRALLYVGILLCILVVAMAIYTIASNYKNPSKAHNQTRIIENIDRYFESRRQDFTIFDVPRNLELNITDEVKIQMLPTPNFTKLDGDEFDGEFVEIKRVDEVINNDTNSTINNSKDLNSTLNLKANPSQKLAINSSENTNIKPKLTNKPKSNKPKLAIIIDDISTFYHAKKIKSLNLNITPSIFPISQNYPQTISVSREFKFYMIHLPLEAINYPYEEKNTLKVGDSIEKINKQIAKIRSDFPNAIYINNHTGSKFTSDYSSMKILFNSLKTYKMIFIDSYTTKESKAGILSKEFGNKYLKRDVFIDNSKDEKAIINQIRRAIKIAKISGQAIAIGHPYSQTFKALEVMKNELKNEVELVFVKDLYELYN